MNKLTISETPVSLQKILSTINDKNKSSNLYKMLKSVTKLMGDNQVPCTESPLDLPDKFVDFFLNIMPKIKVHFQEQDKHKIYHRKCTKFTSFVPLEKDEILCIINNMDRTICTKDPCNTYFVLKFKKTTLDTITIIVNQSLSMGLF